MRSMLIAAVAAALSFTAAQAADRERSLDKAAPTCRNAHGRLVKCLSPATSAAPIGATARCKDGTFSWSQRHSGPCMHHGGVASWLR